MYSEPLPEHAAVIGGGGQPPKPTNSGFYPKPEADYQQLVQTSDGFLQKLQSFHSAFGTKFKLPVVGGNSLDLHRLFVEVTSRGGIEKVVRDRRWKEITRSFRFPSSITSASFVLRKYYLSLLYHFEQVYYLQKETPPASVAADDGNRSVNEPGAQQPPDYDANAETVRLGDGSLVTGTIDAKFDYGYLVTVTFGREKLSGVLYHSPSDVQTLQRCVSVSAFSPIDRRRRIGPKDPSLPKRNRSGYNFFFSENYIRLKASYHGQERALTRKIGILWNRLSDAEKKVYQEKGKSDKERHKREMLEYNASHISEDD